MLQPHRNDLASDPVALTYDAVKVAFDFRGVNDGDGLQVLHDRARRRVHLQRNFAITPAVSSMRFEKPHSLSYQETTRTNLPSITVVSRLSTVELAG
ncbi:hypothetical protein SAMN05518801_10590 [Novosphingobium sp. CF614]|nr:hypothetical protein SAMN05518801_10590 [Novosphingobium sp. CF614]